MVQYRKLGQYQEAYLGFVRRKSRINICSHRAWSQMISASLATLHQHFNLLCPMEIDSRTYESFDPFVTVSVHFVHCRFYGLLHIHKRKRRCHFRIGKQPTKSTYRTAWEFFEVDFHKFWIFLDKLFNNTIYRFSSLLSVTDCFR